MNWTVLALLAVGNFTPTSEPPVEDVSTWELVRLLPASRLAVPGTVRGVLWTSGLGGSPAASGADYLFSFDRQAGELVEFVTPDGQSTYVGKGRGERAGDVEKIKTLRPGAPNEWKLGAEAHVVELEVNRGKGRPALPVGSSSTIVASKVRILDGRAFPAPVADVIAWSAASFERTVRDHGYGDLLDGTRRVTAHPTWLRDKQSLVVLFVLQALGKDALPLECAPCIRNRECACAYTGVALAGELTFDAKAHLVRRTFYLPHPVTVTVVGNQIR